MRKSAFPVLLAAAATVSAAPASAATYETLTARVAAVQSNGLVTLHDHSTLALVDATTRVDGVAEPGADVTVTYSADENGYAIAAVRFSNPGPGSLRQ